MISQFQDFLRCRNDFLQFQAEKAERLKQARIKLEQQQSRSLDDLISSARREVDVKGENQGEYPIGPNGNFHMDDIRRICRVCNMELNSISNFEAHRKGKKHLKRQSDFDHTGKYEKGLQLIIAKGEALWQKQNSSSNGTVSKNTPKQVTDGLDLRGVAGEVLWYPKSDFEIVTRVTPDV